MLTLHNRQRNPRSRLPPRATLQVSVRLRQQEAGGEGLFLEQVNPGPVTLPRWASSRQNGPLHQVTCPRQPRGRGRNQDEEAECQRDHLNSRSLPRLLAGGFLKRKSTECPPPPPGLDRPPKHRGGGCITRRPPGRLERPVARS